MSALLNDFAASLEAEDGLARSTQSELSFSLRPSLWSHVSSLLQPAEVEEARHLIGSSLIADNAAIEEEIRALLYIAASSINPPLPGLSPLHTPSSSPPPPSSSPFVPPLPSLFGLSQKEGLKDEIAYLISALRDKAAESSRGTEELTRLVRGGLSEREAAIVSLVEREQRKRQHSSRSDSDASSTSSRATTNRSRDSRPSTSTSLSSLSISRTRPLSSHSPSSSTATTTRLAGLSTSSLSIFTLDGVVCRIRQALVEEHTELLKDAEFLLANIEEEEQSLAVSRREEESESASAVIAPPTENELRALNERLVVAMQKEEERERAMRIMASVPQRPTFQSKPQPRGSRERTANGETRESLGMEEGGVETVESLLASLDALEGFLPLSRSHGRRWHLLRMSCHWRTSVREVAVLRLRQLWW